MAVILFLTGLTLTEFVYIIILYDKHKKLGELTKQLAVEEERYRIATEITNDILFEYDILTDRMKFADKYIENFGGGVCKKEYSLEKENADYIHEEDLSVFCSFISSLQEGTPNIEAEFRMKDIKQTFVWCQLKGKTIYDNNRNPLKVIGKIINIDIQKKELEILQRKSQLDPLTNAFNKTTTKDKIEEKIRESKEGDIHALMIIDIDDFKKINDTYGHILGDKVLVNIISHIRRMFRDDDIVGRIGGDEFVVFMNHVNAREDITNKALSLFNAFKNHYREKDEDIDVTGSIGISLYPLDGTNYEELLLKADKALYEVKAKGKNNFNIYAKTE